MTLRMSRWFTLNLALALALAVTAAGCLSPNSLARSRHHIRAGEQARARADFETARRELDEAEGAAGEDRKLLNDVARARGAVERDVVRATLPALAGRVGGDAAVFAALWELRGRLADAGGDAALDGAIVAAMNTRARLVVEGAAAAFTSGDGGWAEMQAARQMVRYPDIDAALLERIRAVESAAAARHWRRGEALAAQPLARRIHHGLAATYAGGTVDDATALLDPFRPGVVIAASARDGACGEAAELVAASLRQPGTVRRVEGEVVIDGCAASETRTTTDETVTWNETIEWTEPRQQSRQACYDRVVDNSWRSCTITYTQGVGNSQTCVDYPSSYTVPVCETVTETVDVLMSRTEPRSGSRPVTRRILSAAVTGSYTLRRGDEVRAGRFEIPLALTDESYPAIGNAAGRAGDPTSLVELGRRARATAAEQVRIEIQGLFAADIARAEADARAAAAAGRGDDEEQHAAIAIVSGGDDAGVFGRRYGVTAAQVRAALGSTFATWQPDVVGRPGVRSFELGDHERRAIEVQHRSRLSPPMAGHIWVLGEVGVTYVPLTTSPSTPEELAGDGGVVLGVRFGGSLLGLKRKSPWGLGIVDDASLTLATGIKAQGAESGISSRILAATVQYAAAVGARKDGLGGVFVGLRPAAGYFQVGASSGSYASVPLFGRAELILSSGSLTVEAYARPLVGAPMWGGTLHLAEEANRKQVTRFVTVRAERVVMDADIDIFTDDPTDGPTPVEDLAFTTITATFGIGF